MIVRFKKIPCSVRFTVFDRVNIGKDRALHFDVKAGDSELNIKIPTEWDSPYRTLAAGSEYYVPYERQAITNIKKDLMITGENFYLDVSRTPGNEELNQKDVENLIITVRDNETLTGRQKFYICLISLQSFYEHLVFGMLVLSGYKTKKQFKDLRYHEKRTDEAFSKNNTCFFSTQINICPNKENLGNDIPDETRDKAKLIFHKIRKLRNDVVHGWGYKDIGRSELKAIFKEIGESMQWHAPEDDNGFYKDAAFIFVRLYCRTNPIKNQLNYFIEKEAIRAERASRGY